MCSVFELPDGWSLSTTRPRWETHIGRAPGGEEAGAQKGWLALGESLNQSCLPSSFYVGPFTLTVDSEILLASNWTGGHLLLGPRKTREHARV